MLDVSFGLRAGDIGVLIGPSGCGKATLLRAVAGLEPVVAGVIKLAGQVVSSATRNMAPEARQIGMVFQDYALFPHLNVARNVGFGINNLPGTERAERVAEEQTVAILESMKMEIPVEAPAAGCVLVVHVSEGEAVDDGMLLFTLE